MKWRFEIHMIETYVEKALMPGIWEIGFAQELHYMRKG